MEYVRSKVGAETLRMICEKGYETNITTLSI